MNQHSLGPLAGIAGGLLWVARWGSDLAGSAAGWGSAARWAGLVLILLALAAGGAGLVSRSALWLRRLVAVAFPLLVWSVYLVVRGEGDAVGLDGVLGVLAVAVSVLVLLKSRHVEPEVGRARTGSHASR